jgi:hypothetical protein
MPFYIGQSVRAILPDSSFHNQTGKIINFFELTGSDDGCGTNITVKLDETGYEIDVNIFSRISLEPLYSDNTTTQL